MRFSLTRKRFRDLSEQEVLALAISSEEDDARIYRGYAERLRADFPDSAAVFEGMATEEDTHRKRLIDLHTTRFGPTIPLIRREHVSGFYARRPLWPSFTAAPMRWARRRASGTRPRSVRAASARRTASGGAPTH